MGELLTTKDGKGREHNIFTLKWSRLIADSLTLKQVDMGGCSVKST